MAENEAPEKQLPEEPRGVADPLAAEALLRDEAALPALRKLFFPRIPGPPDWDKRNENDTLFATDN